MLLAKTIDRQVYFNGQEKDQSDRRRKYIYPAEIADLAEDRICIFSALSVKSAGD